MAKKVKFEKTKKSTTLVVRELEISDAYVYSKIAYGENLHKYASFFEANSVESAEKRIIQNSTPLFSNIYGLFTKGGRLVASFIVSSEVFPDEDSKLGANVHYFVGEKYWGNNYAYHGIRLLAKNLKQYNFFKFAIKKTNSASIAVQKKLGSIMEEENNEYLYFRFNF